MSGKQGLFITVEGIEGCGKSTQAKLLAAHLSARGTDTILTREPGGTPIGDLVRQILLDPEHKDMSPRGELLLYAAARAQHVDAIIRPALEEGKVVICDRYTDSTLAYQGYGLGLDMEMIRTINAVATGRLFPHLTFLFDIEPESGLSRKFGTTLVSRAGADRIEQRTLDYHRRVRSAYLSIASEHPERVRVIDAEQTIELIHEAVLRGVAQEMEVIEAGRWVPASETR